MSKSGLDYDWKYVDEIEFFGVDFTDGLDDTETIDATSVNTTVTAKDNEGTVDATIIVALTLQASSDGKILKAQFTLGTEAKSPYVVTFKGFTTSDNQLEYKFKLNIRTS